MPRWFSLDQWLHADLSSHSGAGLLFLRLVLSGGMDPQYLWFSLRRWLTVTGMVLPVVSGPRGASGSLVLTGLAPLLVLSVCMDPRHRIGSRHLQGWTRFMWFSHCCWSLSGQWFSRFPWMLVLIGSRLFRGCSP